LDIFLNSNALSLFGSNYQHQKVTFKFLEDAEKEDKVEGKTHGPKKNLL
jgi:hypothetical protein